MAKHYSYGSGMFGCLYDSGPHFCEHMLDAIDSLINTFQDDLCEGEPARMHTNLLGEGYHAFENPLEAGAQYCEITERSGECPEQDCD